jgi:hypothetical protein
MSVSAHGDRKHCTSITTAGQKKHLFHLTKRVRAPFHTTCCARAIGGATAREFSSAAHASHRAFFPECSKPRFHKGFCDIIKHRATFLQTAARRAGSTAKAAPRGSQSAELPRKKSLENLRARPIPKPGFDANRANRLQVIRGRRRRNDGLETPPSRHDDIFSPIG